MRWKVPFLTVLFLVLLRLAIGWHFLYEGYHKVHSLAVGDTTTNKPFSSAGYFREAHGPLAGYFQQAIGDPDDRLLERLTPVPSNSDTKAETGRSRTPAALARDWQDYFNRFAAHYRLDDRQRSDAQTKLARAEADFVNWLTSKSKAVAKAYPSGTVELTEPNLQRVEEYRDAVRRLRETFTKELPAFGRDVEKARLAKAKADVAVLRTTLEADLEEQSAAMKKALAEVLTDDQRKLDVVPQAETAPFLKSLDTGTAWFLFGVGAALLLGLFTRLSCVLAAAFLLITYGVMPAFPWLPVPPQQEGSYYFISKNVIEMLALLALATTPSGRWFGVDALLYQVWLTVSGRKNRRSLAIAPSALAETASVAGGEQYGSRQVRGD